MKSEHLNAQQADLLYALKHLYHNAYKSGADMGLALDFAREAIAKFENEGKNLDVKAEFEWWASNALMHPYNLDVDEISGCYDKASTRHAYQAFSAGAEIAMLKGEK